MPSEPLQLQLFESSTSPSLTSAPSSQRSSELATFSGGGSPNTPTVVTTTAPTAHALDSATHAGAAPAVRSFSAATNTAASEEQATLSIFTSPRHTPDPMLAIPRPMVRAECLHEARPCPWVSCRHHLLLEVAETNGGLDVRPTTLRLNRPRIGGDQTMGRRSGLASSAANHLVEQWIDDAVEHLAGMRYSCVLDIADEYPDGLTERSVGLLLGVTESAARADIARAVDTLQAEFDEREGRTVGTTPPARRAPQFATSPMNISMSNE
jgi:hypothetical protein